jgi:hypothetical protein
MKPWMPYALGAALLAAGLLVARSLAAGPQAPQVAPSAQLAAGRFPKVSSSNLEGRKFNLPDDFAGRYNLLAVAFLREHQDLVDTWQPTVKRLTGRHDTLRFYELPTLTSGTGLARWFIDGGMRAGIPDRAVREVTITLYLDRPAFLKAIGETSTATIHVLLVTQQGEILWRGHGAATASQEADLEQVLARLP